MTLLIILLFLAGAGLFVYSFFAKDYQSEVDTQVSNVQINLMREINQLKDKLKEVKEGGVKRG
ncbi:hypothetical protein [Alkalihalobacterium chitinilyticum]|uniref:Uncharacterized protein n=1 Tax=Alkalihalobacterium chitinilyticum TaxID=2980103 RepID=A0ABT5VIV5_9BACI|nr:hypothetical protein [Alkalihalobacterium chitinilyticum]MDE5415383.1 hypothetical protein [Alkalihalobacterium chitinilyticum]